MEHQPAEIDTLDPSEYPCGRLRKRVRLLREADGGIFSRVMMNPRRVLFLLASDWYFYWHRLALAERIAARGYEVHVAAPEGRFRAGIEAAGLRFHPVRMDRQGLNPFKDLVTIKDVVDLYRALKPDLVHHASR